MNTQDRTIRDFVQSFRKEAMIKSLNGKLDSSGVGMMDLLNEFEKKYLVELKQPEKQDVGASVGSVIIKFPEKQEIEIAEEITEPLVYTNLIENRKLIIELQERFNEANKYVEKYKLREQNRNKLLEK